MNLRPVDLVGMLTGTLEQPDAGAATGQHDVCLAAFVDRISYRVDQPIACRGDKCIGVGVFLDDRGHTYCTFSMPWSAS